MAEKIIFLLFEEWFYVIANLFLLALSNYNS